MRIVTSKWAPAAAIALLSAGFSCATANNEAGVDAGGGTTPVIVGFDAAQEASSVIIIRGGMDAGLPTVTVTDDGGPASLNPDTGTTAPPDDAAGPTGTGSGADASEPPADAGTGPGTGTGTGSDSGGVPTTCAEADEQVGCCVGNTRYYCSGGTVASDDCSENQRVCGWSSSHENYGCVSAPAEADPSGTYSLTCGGGGSGTGTGTGSGGGAVPTTCAAANYTVGCCANGVNYYCNSANSTTVEQQTCTASSPCGWGEDSKGQGIYGCGGQGTDPSGKNPIACQ